LATWSSIDDGVDGETTLGCETANGEVVRISASGDFDGSEEVEENHLREIGIGTDTDSDGALFSTMARSGFGGVGGMTFVTGSWDISGAGEPVRVGSFVEYGSPVGRNLLGRLEDEDDANHVRLLGKDLISAYGRVGGSATCDSKGGWVAGAGLGSRRSVGGGTIVSVEGAGSGVVGRSSAGKGGICLPSSFNGVLED